MLITVDQQGSLISISLESSKIHLLMKVVYMWFNLCRRFLVPCSECLLKLVQLNVLVTKLLKTWNISTLPMLVYWPRFCIVLKLSLALDGLFSVLSNSRLHGRNKNALLLNEVSLNVTSSFRSLLFHVTPYLTTFRLLLLQRDFLWHGTHYLFSVITYLVTAMGPVFVEYIFPHF